MTRRAHHRPRRSADLSAVISYSLNALLTNGAEVLEDLCDELDPYEGESTQELVRRVFNLEREDLECVVLLMCWGTMLERLGPT